MIAMQSFVKMYTVFFLLFLQTCVNLSEAEIQSRIIDGVLASKGQFPFQAAIYISTIQEQRFCGGSILNPTWILSAAHCIKDATAITVTVGTVTLDDPERQILSASRVVTHPNYHQTRLFNDIGLISLSKKIEFGEFVKPIKLPSESLGEGVTVSVSGWGKTNAFSNKKSNSLNYITVTTISNKKCAQLYGSTLLHGTIVCTEGSGIQNTCSGDSGSALISGDSSNAVLVGVTSFGIFLCSMGIPHGFTRVLPYKSWILSYIENN